jgi:carbamoyltransferase
MMLVADVALDRLRKLTDEEEALWGIDKLNVVRSEIPAVTHVDYSSRIQTVRRDTNPLYWEIIEAACRKTGCPVIVNTSFNIRGEPIVCSIQDSYRCFMRTEMDALVLETCVLEKQNQPQFVDDSNWRKEFDPD